MGDEGSSRRDMLLAAGRALLAEGEADLLSGALTIDRVAARAGVTAQTFHNTFPSRNGIGSKARYLDELLKSVSADTGGRADRRRAQIDRLLAEATGDPRRSIREICRWDYRQLRDDPATQLGFVVRTVAARHRDAAAAVRREYSAMSGISRDLYDGALRRWGAGLRKPFTVDSLAVVVTALAEGLVLRSRFEPDAVPDDLLGDAVLALLAAIVDPDHRQAHIDDVIAPLAAEVMRDYRLTRSDEFPDDPQRAIIEAATAEFAQRGYANTEPAHIALAAGVDLPTLRRLFPSKAHLVVDGLKPAFETVRRQTDADRKLHSPVTVVHRFTDRLARMIIDHRTLADAMVLVASVDTAQAPNNLILLKAELDFPQLIVAVIEDGQAGGDFITTGLPPLDLAAMVTNNVIFRCLSRRTESAREVAAAINQVVVRGLLHA